MKVFEIMTIDVETVAPEDDLGRAAEIMWRRDCGVVPVVDADRRLLGVVTDRDIAIAAATRGLAPFGISAGSMIGRPAVTCSMGDSVAAAIRTMRNGKVRRIPVVGERGELLGIVSVADILRTAGTGKAQTKRIIKLLRSLADPDNPDTAGKR